MRKFLTGCPQIDGARHGLFMCMAALSYQLVCSSPRRKPGAYLCTKCRPWSAMLDRDVSRSVQPSAAIPWITETTQESESKQDTDVESTRSMYSRTAAAPTWKSSRTPDLVFGTRPASTSATIRVESESLRHLRWKRDGGDVGLIKVLVLCCSPRRAPQPGVFDVYIVI